MTNASENPPEVVNNLQLTPDIHLTSNTASDDRWKIRFGFVVARPHEYLIHIRSGKIQRRTTGQASRCFKLPGDTVVLVPTSLKQLIFEAGQITLDNILVRIRGFAIYRISQPEKTYDRISFWNRQDGEKKLALMIGEPCRSHTKWLVSNMTFEDCMRKRKEAIADILLKELKVVINEENFGVTIETIDIQDVRFGADEVFEAFQGPSKEDIFKTRELAQLSRERDVAVRKLQQDQEIQEKRKESRLKELTISSEIVSAEQQAERLKQEEQRKLELDKAAHDRTVAREKLDHQLQLQQESARVEQELTLARLQLEKAKTELELEMLRQRTAIDNSLSPIAIEKLFLEKSLPNLADSIGMALQDARLTVYQGGENGGLPISMVLSEIMGILQKRLDQLDFNIVEDDDADE